MPLRLPSNTEGRKRKEEGMVWFGSGQGTVGRLIGGVMGCRKVLEGQERCGAAYVGSGVCCATLDGGGSVVSGGGVAW